MDYDVLIENIKSRCKEIGVPVTTACEACNVGKNFVANIKKGSAPSIEKVQMLSKYLGVTVSDLLGEEKCAPIDDGSAHAQLLNLVSGYSEEEAARAAAILRAAFGRQVE